MLGAFAVSLILTEVVPAYLYPLNGLAELIQLARNSNVC